jgi:hypothetical protein
MMRRLYLLVRSFFDRLTQPTKVQPKNILINIQTKPILQPGQEGERLPDGVIVLRLGKLSKDAQLAPEANEMHFTLSSEDKASKLQALTVWAEELTSAQTARDLMGANRAEYRLVLHLNVDDIRAIRYPSDSTESMLEVVWDPDTHPGAEGHAGIIGLNRGAKATRKALRLRLADLANRIKPELLPD